MSACQATSRRRRPHALQLPPELNQIVLFLGSEFEFQDQVEELDRVLQGQAAAVVQIRRAILDAAEREALIGPSPASSFRNRSTCRSCIWLSR